MEVFLFVCLLLFFSKGCFEDLCKTKVLDPKNYWPEWKTLFPFSILSIRPD